MHLPAAFRSLPRPSSPPGAKASPMRPYFASISLRYNIRRTRCFFLSTSWAFFLWLNYLTLLLLNFFASLFLPALSMNFLFPYTHFQIATQALIRSILVEGYNGNMNWSRSNVGSFEPTPPSGLMSSVYLILRLFLVYLVEDQGFEPRTPCVQGRCSSQLS